MISNDTPGVCDGTRSRRSISPAGSRPTFARNGRLSSRMRPFDKARVRAVIAPFNSGKYEGARLYPPRRDTSATRRRAGHADRRRSEEHTSELQSLMRISYDVFCLNKKKKTNSPASNKH